MLPIGAAVFNQKVLQRWAETAVITSSRGVTCDVCEKGLDTRSFTHL